MEDMFLKQVESLVQQEKYYNARKLLLNEIKQKPTDTRFWDPLANTYLYQGYIKEAYEIYYCLNLIYPKDKTYQGILEKLEHSTRHAKKQSTFFENILNLKSSTITAATIFKNEINTVEKWYTALKGQVDSIIAVDTGSTDGTREFLLSQNDVVVIDSPWNDSFSEARNAAIPFITSDWVIWVDTDEFLINRLKSINSIRFIANYYEEFNNHVRLQVTIENIIENNRSKNYDIARMYKPSQYKFAGRIHEQIIKVPANKNKDMLCYTGILFEHIGYEPQIKVRKNKLARNLKLLKMDAQENPQDALTFLYLGRETNAIREYQEAIDYLKIAEQNALADPLFIRKLDIYKHLIFAQIQCGLLDEAEHTCQKALATDPSFPDAHYYLNKLHLEKTKKQLHDLFNKIQNIDTHISNYNGHVSPNPKIISHAKETLKAEALIFNGHLAEAQAILTNLPQDQLGEEGNLFSDFIKSQKNKLN